MRINRTSVELKPAIAALNAAALTGINRTSVELKLCRYLSESFSVFCINRTSVELKQISRYRQQR